MKPVSCDLWRMFESFLFGIIMIFGWTNIDIIVTLDEGSKMSIYTIYHGIILLCVCMALELDMYYPQAFISFLLAHAAFCLTIVGMRLSVSHMYFIYLPVMASTAFVNSFLLITGCCEYTSNPLSAVGLLIGGFASMLMPRFLRTVMVSPMKWGLEMLPQDKIGESLVTLKFFLTMVILAIRPRKPGEQLFIFRPALWNQYKGFIRLGRFLNRWSEPVPYLLHTWNSRESLWETLANLAAMIALVTAFPPSLTLLQLPISPSWLKDIKQLESWLLYAGLVAGAFLPPLDHLRYLLPLLIFGAYMMHCCCCVLFIGFTSISWIKPYAVAYICAATCGIYGYAITSTLSRFVAMFFMRHCENFEISDQCCLETEKGNCICKNRIGYGECEPKVERLEAFKEKVDKEVDSKYEKMKRDKAATGAECQQAEQKAQQQLQQQQQAKGQADNEKKEKEKQETINKPVSHVIWVNSPHGSMQPPECTALKCSCKSASSSGTTNNCLRCTQNHNSSSKCPVTEKATQSAAASTSTTSSQTCDAKTPEKVCLCSMYCSAYECRNDGKCCGTNKDAEAQTAQVTCENLVLSNAQHYLLGNAYASSCECCDLTLQLEGTPLWNPGDYCCIPTPGAPPRPYKWREYDPEKDRIYLGYIGSQCTLCSLVEVMKLDPITNHMMDIDLYDNHYTIARLCFGSCCHAPFILRAGLDKREKKVSCFRRENISTLQRLNYVYFTTVSLKKKKDGDTSSNNSGASKAPAAKTKSASEKTSCIGVASRVFVKYGDGNGPCVTEAGGNTSNKRCQCTNNYCDLGCCIKLRVTEDNNMRNLRGAQRIVVVVRFLLLFIFFVLGLRLVAYKCCHKGASTPFSFQADLRNTWQAVYQPNWYLSTADALEQGISDALKVREHDSEEGLELVLRHLGIFFQNRQLKALEDQVRKTVASHLSNEPIMGTRTGYYSFCVALCLDALRQCFSSRKEALERYFLQWESRWHKELCHYNESFGGLIGSQAFGVMVAQSFESDVRTSNKSRKLISQITEHGVESIQKEIALHKELNNHEVAVETMLKETPMEAVPSIKERMTHVWDGRLRFLELWMLHRRTIYDWRGFLVTYSVLKHYYTAEEATFL